MSLSRVLIVDDDPSACQIVSTVLTRRGYCVDSATDVTTGLRLVAENEYGLAILDYQMPEMNGIEFLERARELQPKMQSIFVTAYTTIHTVFPAIHAGAERVLAKPADARELITVVEAMIGPPPEANESPANAT